MDQGARTQQPLSIPWRDWLRTADWEGGCYAGAPLDAIVIGSGYGGSVAALRLVEKGYRTLLLERGSEFLPGEFPNDFSLVPKSLRVNIPLREQPVGRAAGLIEVHVGQGFVALGGNGLGGGSLVNAGVAMRPDRDVFQQQHWPAAIRNEPQSMDPWLDRAHQHLGAQAWPDLPDGRRLRKTEALQRLGDSLRGTFRAVDVTIDADKCVRCGDCASGCNVPGAKKTLAATYLAKAVALGRLTIVTQAEAYTFAPGGGKGDAFRWCVKAFATDAQQQFTATRQVVEDQSPSATHRVVEAPHLFVCAGTLGSTQLLQRSQARSGSRLQFSSALGTRLSGNGDSLSWVADDEELASSHGRGVARASGEMRKAWDGQAYDRDLLVGPTITGALHVRGSEKADVHPPPLHERLVVEDGAVPRAIAQLASELLASAHTLRQLDAWSFGMPRHRGAESEDPLSAGVARAQHAQVLLTMGHDESKGRLVWLEDTDRTAPYLADARKIHGYEAQATAFKRLGKRHVHNPVWQPLPESATQLMSGAEVPASVTTVHPLGGCVMGDSVEAGVVDDLGRVWVRDPGCPALPPASLDTDSEGPGGQPAPATRPHRYRGLYVLDGSIVPTSLGCNPLLTITALAERALDALPAKALAPAGEPRRAHAREARPQPLVEVPIAATLRETLVAREFALPSSLAARFGGVALAARFEAEFPSDDLLRTMSRARHGFPVQGRLLVGPREPQEGVAPVTYTIHPERSSFHFLPAGRGSGGPWPTVWTLLQAPAAALALLVTIPLSALSFRLQAWALLPLLPLPLMRSLLTWWVLRGRADMLVNPPDVSKWIPWAGTMLRQMVHASEKRVMRYRVQLQLQDAERLEGWPRSLVLHARKRVAYRASLGELFAWMRGRSHVAVDGSKEPAPIRPTFWEQAMDADVRLSNGRSTLASGTFRMGIENFLAVGTRKGTVAPPFSLGRAGDTTTGLLAAASYPLLFLRFGLKTRLLDFRLPAYSSLPVGETLDATQNAIFRGTLVPSVHWIEVRHGNSSGDAGGESTAPVRLPLLRYARPDQPAFVEGTWNGRRVTRAKSILLTHAFGQSGFTFTFTHDAKPGPNLAEALHEAGYDVWVLDSRMSTRVKTNAEPSTVDQIARYDIPKAVDTILGILGHEAPEEHRSHPLQIAAFAHCIGSAALWVSLLDGRLSHDRDPDVRGPRLSKLSHAVFSQLHPYVVGGRVPQSKTWVPAMLAKLGMATVPFAVRGRQDDLLHQIVDRVFASLPAPHAERQSLDNHDDAAATMRRIRYIDAQLWRQDRLDGPTRAAMNRLFGEANLRLFGQARRFVDHKRLVTEDGSNLFVTPSNIERHLALPIQLLHGEDNQLFDVAGAEQTFEKVGFVHRDLQQRFCKPVGGQGTGFLRIPGYGHLDVLIGRDAHRDVFPHVVDFLQRVHAADEHVAQPGPRTGWIVRPPVLGPFIGWTRRDAQGRLVVRMSFVVDDGRRAWTCHPDHILLRRLQGAVYVTLDAPVVAVDVNDPFRCVVIDVQFDEDPATDQWQLLLLSESREPHSIAREVLDDPTLRDPAIDMFIADAARRRPQPVVPPLCDTSWDYEPSFFTLPRRTIENLAPGKAVTLGVGSCRYPGLGLDRDRVDATLQEFVRGGRAARTDVAMLLGDQIYADATAGVVDPLSPMERYLERHRDAFMRGSLGDLLARMPVYMVADDHEWTDNYPSASPLARRPWPAWMRRDPVEPKFGAADIGAFNMAGRAVRDFQRLQGPWPLTAAPVLLEGMRDNPRPFLRDYRFEHGCAQVYVLDSRARRTRNPARIVPNLRRLELWLTKCATQGPVVIATGSVVLPGLRSNADPADGGQPDTWQYAPAQRAELLDLLVEHAAGRFILLSGDYHVSGMVDIRDGDRVVGCAVVAPPLYAPLPYANSTPESVFVDEAVQLPSGKRLHMRVREGGEFARGSGIGLLTVAPGGPQGVHYQRTLWVWEEGRQAEYDTRSGAPSHQGMDGPGPATAPVPSPAGVVPAAAATP